MDSLSNEMLIAIFKWLPAKTRREARLVCQKWNKICLSYTFTKNEKFVFSPGFDLHSVARYCAFGHRRTLHLHFICVSLIRTDIEMFFWRSYGEWVESIDLVEANFDFTELKSVIEFCPNLKSLKFQYCASLPIWLNNFDAFVEMHFIAPSVTTFHFQCQRSGRQLLPSNYVISEILAMFPNLTDLKLEFKFDVDQRPIPENLDVQSKKTLSIFGLLQIIGGIAKNLKKLYLKTNADHALYPDVTTLLSKLKKIEELTLIPSFNFVDLNLPQPYEPLLKLTGVTSLRLAMGYISFRKSETEFISLVLREFPNLRHLYLDFIRTLELSEGLIQSLVHSALKTLLLGFRKFALEANVEHYNSSFHNRTLKTVSMYSKQTQNNEDYALFFSILGQYFLNIDALTVAYPNDSILQHIFHYQKHLKKLRLESCHFCTDMGFTGLSSSTAANGEQGTYCISELSNLEFLRIRPASRISEKTFAALILPKLKTLELVEFGDLDQGMYLCQKPMNCLIKFESLMKNSPLLQVLQLNTFNFISEVELTEMLRPFKQLRYIKITDRNSEDSCPWQRQQAVIEAPVYHYKRFFEMCPLLQKIIHNNRYCYINILTKKLIGTSVIGFDSYLLPCFIDGN